MTTPHLAHAIEAEEGRRLHAYPDPLTGGAPWTIGVGHTGPEVKQGLTWTDAQASAALDADIERACARLDQALPWWRDLNDPRQDVLAQMAFQIGVKGLLAFRRTLEAMRNHDYAAAAAGMRASLWARQTPARAERLARIMEAGAYPA
jgi:lysozyme